MVHAVHNIKSGVVLQFFLFRPVNMFSCHWSSLSLRSPAFHTMETNHTCTNSRSTAIFWMSEKIFYRHTVCVCKHTAQLYSAKSVPTRWVRYIVAISTKFGAYLTTFLIELEYKKVPNFGKNVKIGMMLGFLQRHEIFFTDTANLLTLLF